MSYKEDWLLRQIESIVAFIIYLMTGKNLNSTEFESFRESSLDTNKLYNKLNSLIKEGKICEAEDILYERIENDDKEAFDAGISFYATINKISDEELDKSNFPRDEILSGLQDMSSIYGLNIPLNIKDI